MDTGKRIYSYDLLALLVDANSNTFVLCFRCITYRTCTWSDGRVYEGYWFMGQAHGEGKGTLQFPFSTPNHFQLFHRRRLFQKQIQMEALGMMVNGNTIPQSELGARVIVAHVRFLKSSCNLKMFYPLKFTDNNDTILLEHF